MERVDQQEVKDVNNSTAQRLTLHPLSLNRASTSVWERLLNQADPQDQPLNLALRQGRRLCGRWLALRQHSLRLTNAQVIKQTEVDAQTLLWLKLGLADEALAQQETWTQVALLLAADYADADWVADVMAVALGQRDACAERVIERVCDELQWMQEDDTDHADEEPA